MLDTFSFFTFESFRILTDILIDYLPENILLCKHLQLNIYNDNEKNT